MLHMLRSLACQEFTVVEPALLPIRVVEVVQGREDEQAPEGDVLGHVAMNECRVDGDGGNVGELLGSKLLPCRLQAQSASEMLYGPKLDQGLQPLFPQHKTCRLVIRQLTTLRIPSRRCPNASVLVCQLCSQVRSCEHLPDGVATGARRVTQSPPQLDNHARPEVPLQLLHRALVIWPEHRARCCAVARCDRCLHHNCSWTLAQDVLTDVRVLCFVPHAEQRHCRSVRQLQRRRG